LRERYGLPQQSVIGIDHALGYAALANGSIDVKDAYSTDAKIEDNDLVVLDDDLRFFPKYDAVFLFRSSTSPDAISALRRLEGTLDEKRMIHLNMEAERTKNYTFAANLYFEDGGRSANSVGESFPHKLARWTLRHLELAGFSLLLSVIVGTPLGIVASRGGVIGQGILGFASILQTIPSSCPAGIACPCSFFRDQCSYCDHGSVPLWVIADRAEHCERLAGYSAIVRESAVALGLSSFTRSGRFICQWLALDSLGNQNQRGNQYRHRNAGGIDRCRRFWGADSEWPNLNDHVTILEGAIPAALLALLVQWFFDVLDRVLIPKGLRL
jgi:osmoprotectant transport system permease protein